MDRTLKVYSKTGHLFAEITFHYDRPNNCTAQCTEYRRLYNDDEEDEMKSVYPSYTRDLYISFRQFDSIDQVKAHDKDLVKKELGGDMTDPDSYSYTYDPTPVLLRYVSENHLGCIGMINVLFSFIDNTKEVRFLSAKHPRFDFDISSNSLETNVRCIERIPLFNDWGEQTGISLHDLKRLEPWY